MTQPILIRKDELFAFASAIFIAAGVERAMAKTWADVLVWANMRIAPALASSGGNESPLMNGVAMAIDLRAIGDLDQFTQEADRLGDAISDLPPAQGIERVLLPGERGDRVLAERQLAGIPIANGTWSRIVSAAERVGVAAPL